MISILLLLPILVQQNETHHLHHHTPPLANKINTPPNNKQIQSTPHPNSKNSFPAETSLMHKKEVKKIDPVCCADICGEGK